jgi:hypothetical protein
MTPHITCPSERVFSVGTGFLLLIAASECAMILFWIQVINSVGGPAMEFLGTLEMKRLCEFTLASCESGSEVRSVVG